MRAFVSVIVLLLLFATEASAFRPGPTIVRECPKCSVPIEQRTTASGNTFGARYWSDGKMGAPMLPDYPWLVKCPKCKHLFWIDEAKKLGDTNKGWKGQGKLEPRSPESPTVLDFYTIVPSIKDKEKQRYIRTHLWHCANDPYRDGASTGKVSFSAEAKASMEVLSKLLDDKDPEDRLAKAEIARELGQFDRCIKLLSVSFDKRLSGMADAIRMLAQEKYSPVMEFTWYGHYQSSTGPAKSKPTDIEDRLFVRALRESCVRVASGLLARYGVDALLRGDPEKLKAAVTTGAAKGDDSAVAVTLDQAVRDGSADAVRFLLDSGARVNGRCGYQSLSPLMTACFHGSESMAKLLIERGADVNASGDFHLTPLGLACREKFPGLAKLLLDRGAKVDQGSPDDTPLMTLFTGWGDFADQVEWARNTLEITRLLLERGANPDGVRVIIGDTRSQFWSTPLTEVCGMTFTNDEYGLVHYTPSEKAACEGIFLDILRLLLDRKANVNRCDCYGRSPLLCACEAGNLAAVKLLLERGADVNKAAKDGTTPLSIAEKQPDKAIAKLLLEHGAGPKAGK